ncbi:MAG: hypothetical protein K2X32_07165 [Phycisphaerales bacterium]|nr:hypothetical protein [Phycisphaerales bacterium]
MPPPFNTWEEWLQWALCELYKALDGDCKDLSGQNEDRIAKVIALYQANGAPVFTNRQDKADFLKLLDDLEALLDQPGNDLDAQADANLRMLIASLRTDVGP